MSAPRRTDPAAARSQPRRATWPPPPPTAASPLGPCQARGARTTRRRSPAGAPRPSPRLRPPAPPSSSRRRAPPPFAAARSARRRPVSPGARIASPRPDPAAPGPDPPLPPVPVRRSSPELRRHRLVARSGRVDEIHPSHDPNAPPPVPDPSVLHPLVQSFAG
nr:vegetative cell wall protein gp1-like [Aegilops tauschii subsp. strangulata]